MQVARELKQNVRSLHFSPTENCLSHKIISLVFSGQATSPAICYKSQIEFTALEGQTAKKRYR